MTRRFVLGLIALPSFARVRRDIRQTAARMRALELRRQLRALNMYDELPENWTEVERALADGCEHFTAAVSRIERDGAKRTLWRVLPIVAPPNEHGYFVPWNQRSLTSSTLVPDR